MINMAFTPEEAKEYGADAGDVKSEAPKYPYGLCLCLNDDSLAKLGITTPLPVGTEVVITARAKIVSTGAREDADGESEANMDVQITDMELTAGSSRSNGDIAKTMYPGMT